MRLFEISRATTIHDGFQFIDPTARRDQIRDEILPEGENVEATYLARVTTTRKRIKDDTGRRVTRDWRIGYFILWQDGQPPPILDRETYRVILQEADRYHVDEIVVFGKMAAISSARIAFRQFGVRDLTTLDGTSFRQSSR